MEYFIFCDGSCYNKDGHNTTGYAAVLTDRMFATHDNVLKKRTGWDPVGTNNTAEWDALILGMILMLEHDLKTRDFNGYHIFTDSELIANQANGDYKVRNQTLWPYHKKFKELKKRARACRIEFSIQWIPREQNKIADHYSREANPHYTPAKGKYQ
jgi:ribonuclease HI